jgi:hypothetical protein|tara:strand:- start:881 stop:1225 length:345 start_codon:yes stop_codon:yes gene_type:complete
MCSDILGMGYVALFVRVIELQTLKMLRIVANDVEFVQDAKIKLLRELNTSEEEIKFIKDVDRKTFDSWKESVIIHFIAAYPGKYRNQIEFTNWQGAMKQLKYIEKQQANKKQFK